MAKGLRSLTPNRTVRDEMKILLALGFVYEGTYGGHHRFTHPSYGSLKPLSSTPKRPHAWKRRHRAEVAALMGLTLWQFERRLAGQPATKSPSQRRRRRVGRTDRGPRRSTVSLVRTAEHHEREQGDADVCRCGRKWLSDISPAGRRCPSCDGLVQVAA